MFQEKLCKNWNSPQILQWIGKRFKWEIYGNFLSTKDNR